MLPLRELLEEEAVVVAPPPHTPIAFRKHPVIRIHMENENQGRPPKISTTRGRGLFVITDERLDKAIDWEVERVKKRLGYGSHIAGFCGKAYSLEILH